MKYEFGVMSESTQLENGLHKVYDVAQEVEAKAKSETMIESWMKTENLSYHCSNWKKPLEKI